jgi:hypothetical protein
MLEYGNVRTPDFWKWEKMFSFIGKPFTHMDARRFLADPNQALAELSDLFAKVKNPAQQKYIRDALKLSFPEFQLMREGLDRYNELIRKEKEQGVVTREMGEEARRFTNEVNDMTNRLDDLAREITGPLLPSLDELLQKTEKFVHFLKEHKDVGTALFTGIGIAAAGIGLKLALPAIVATAPWLALGLAIGLLADDIKRFKEGADSMISRALERWPILGKIFQSLAENILKNPKRHGETLKIMSVAI